MTHAPLNESRAEKTLSASVVVLTRNRPKELALCLEALSLSRLRPLEILVIDDSDGEPNSHLRRAWPDVRWISGHPSRHRINGLRTLGGQSARGDIVAYLDDDSVVTPHWLEALLAAYADDDVAGVGGQVIEDRPTEAHGTEVGRIGPLLMPVGNFHLALDGPCDVDHLRGCNFSFRRAVLQQVGWFHDGYHGWCLRDDTDICLTIRRHGYRLIFQPQAAIRHLAAPQQNASRSTYNLRRAFVHARWHSYFAVRLGDQWPADRRRLLLVEPLLEPLRIIRQAGKRLLMWLVSVVGMLIGTAAALRSRWGSSGRQKLLRAGRAEGSTVTTGQGDIPVAERSR